MNIPKGEWVEISADDWAEDELEDGTPFEYAIELRTYESFGYSVKYYAVLDD